MGMNSQLNGYDGVAEDYCNAAEGFKSCATPIVQIIRLATDASTSGGSANGRKLCSAVGPPWWSAPVRCYTSFATCPYPLIKRKRPPVPPVLTATEFSFYKAMSEGLRDPHTLYQL